MLSPEIYRFISDLSKNNYREWFQENKTRYQNCKENFLQNLEIIIHEVGKFDKSIPGIAPGDCVFRINRDIRFSNNKEPYKTNFGAFIAPGGQNNGKAGYYIHIEPGNSFLAGGIYMPSSPVLKAIRREVFENYAEFLAIVQQKEFIQHFGGISGDKLKMRPAGFPENFEGMEYLKFKHFTVMKVCSESDLTSEHFIADTVNVFKALFPLNRFLNEAIEKVEE